jgi:hypothetical protein
VPSVPRHGHALAGVAVALLTLAGTAGTASAGTGAARRTNGTIENRVRLRHDTAVSSNWAGYAVTAPASTSTTSATFSSVSARWVEPAASCTAGRRAFSAFWVGLGGFSETAQALEQIGTEADCTAAGKATHSLWYELVPAASVRIKYKVFTGNVIAASVRVKGTLVTLEIRNLTRRTKFAKTARMAAPDVTSAEWVAEAPSACTSSGRCQQLPLTNFGNMTFSKASVTTSDGHAGAISDAAWSPTTIELLESSDQPFAAQTTTGALPSALAPDGTSFAVAWQEAIPLPPDDTGTGTGSG